MWEGGGVCERGGKGVCVWGGEDVGAKEKECGEKSKKEGGGVRDGGVRLRRN